ncbi:DUF4232 domain-containing protein [Paeniglutamicibacter psychrophenolicus]|uniref:DUF4232 domain-containing protein n=1 Tax=Paeniglutamicibacter psychrophenolicus TaxID=257454 RepID=UPI002784EFA1|nr:DUF4232 domain-containing protein [Paeniglutamicibacter psychrophenolicus]MDQ0094317.1 hypothetical protein [Paeniglutamicibacter psychrophenolicus]
MGQHGKTAIGTARIVAGAGILWLFSGALNGWMLAHQVRLPAQFTRMLFPETITMRTWQSAQPWPILLSLFSVLALMAFTLLLLRGAGMRAGKQAGNHPIGFLSMWMSIVLAGFATAAFASLGDVIASWPPARLAWLLDGVQPALLAAGYWGIIWGWLPALAGTLAMKSAKPIPDPKTARRRPDAMPLLVAGMLAVILVVTIPAAYNYTEETQTPQAAPPPTEAPSPTPYGWPDRSDAFQPTGENWCAGEGVSISWHEPEGATGHRGMAFDLTNTGTGPCIVESYPDIAFNNAEGWAIDVLVVHGGSFMTDDPGVSAITLLPGQSARAFLGWNAMAAAGDVRTGTMLVAPYAGTLRHSSPVDLDIIDGGAVSVTAWELVKDPTGTNKSTRPAP